MHNLKPAFNHFKSLAAKHSLVPTYVEIPCDLETPVTAYLKLAGANPYGALMESVEGGERFGRYSFIQVSSHARFECVGRSVRKFEFGKEILVENTDPFKEMRQYFESLNPATLSALPRFCGGAVGMMGYDMVRHIEKLPLLIAPDLNLPDAVLLFTDECVVFDHWKQTMILIKWNRIPPMGKSDLKTITCQF